MLKKTVIVTGAGNGIGKAITKRCLEDGFRVLACDVNVESLASLKQLFRNEDLSVFAVDVSDNSQVLNFFDQLTKEKEQPAYLVNNAGIYLGKSIFDYSVAEIQRVIHVNCCGAIYFSQQFAKIVIPAGRMGVIVNMSSVAGEEGSSDAVYGLSKAALIGLTKSCAMNFAPQIRVNAIAPALVSTNLIQNVPPSRIEEYRTAELLKDPICPEDVANTLAFLFSDQSKHYTGAVFDINNGVYRR